MCIVDIHPLIHSAMICLHKVISNDLQYNAPCNIHEMRYVGHHKAILYNTSLYRQNIARIWMFYVLGSIKVNAENPLTAVAGET